MRKSLRLALTRPTSLYKGGCFPQKDGRRVRVSPNKFVYTKRKSTKKKSLCFFWRRRRDSTGFQPVVFALRTVYFMSLFAPQKDGRRVRVSYPFCIIQKKGTGKNPIPFLAQKERLDGFSTRRVRFANSLFYVPFCSAKRRTKSSSLLPFLHYTEKRYREKSRYLSWRRRRDSNSRAGYPTYALSRGASSPT